MLKQMTEEANAVCSGSCSLSTVNVKSLKLETKFQELRNDEGQLTLPYIVLNRFLMSCL